MTSHELAKALLAGPDVPVAFYEYSGDDILTEVESVTVETEFEGAKLYAVLRTYQP